MNRTDDHIYRNITEDLFFELTNTDIQPRNTTGSLWLYIFTQYYKYINTSDVLYFRSRLVDRNIPEFQILIDLFDYFGGIY